MQKMYRRRSGLRNIIASPTETAIITITKTVFDEPAESKFRIMMKKRWKVFIRQSHEYKCGLLRKELDYIHARQTDPSASPEAGENAFRIKTEFVLPNENFYDTVYRHVTVDKTTLSDE